MNSGLCCSLYNLETHYSYQDNQDNQDYQGYQDNQDNQDYQDYHGYQDYQGFQGYSSRLHKSDLAEILKMPPIRHILDLL